VDSEKVKPHANWRVLYECNPTQIHLNIAQKMHIITPTTRDLSNEFYCQIPARRFQQRKNLVHGKISISDRLYAQIKCMHVFWCDNYCIRRFNCVK
jgi:hypothetical protein